MKRLKRMKKYKLTIFQEFLKEKQNFEQRKMCLDKATTSDMIFTYDKTNLYDLAVDHFSSL